MLASYHGHPDLVKVLLKHGVDPELANDRGQTPLQAVSFKGDRAIAQVLIQGGAGVNGGGPDGKTPLMFAAMFDRLDLVDQLLEQGADPARRTTDGMTAETLARMGRTGCRQSSGPGSASTAGVIDNPAPGEAGSDGGGPAPAQATGQQRRQDRPHCVGAVDQFREEPSGEIRGSAGR